MTAKEIDPTTLPWPYWMLRYVGSDAPQALEDLIWSVGGSPPYGGVSDDEASAVYDLLEDYRGRGAAEAASYTRVQSFIGSQSDSAIALEIFRCVDQIQSAADSYERAPVTRGLELARKIGHRGSEASFLSFEAGWYHRAGDLRSARERSLEALDIYLELADDDPVYTKRVQQSAQNAISFTALSGDKKEARNLLGSLAEVLDAGAAEQFRRSLGSAS